MLKMPCTHVMATTMMATDFEWSSHGGVLQVGVVGEGEVAAEVVVEVVVVVGAAVDQEVEEEAPLQDDRSIAAWCLDCHHPVAGKI